MARPLSQEKRMAILNAATIAVAEAGLGAPIVKIAKAAGVADGTVCVYFPTKDELLNQLYLHINTDLRSAITPEPDGQADLEARLRPFWDGYIAWGLKSPTKYKASRQLNASNVLTTETRAEIRTIFADFDRIIAGATSKGELREFPEVFVCGLMDAVAGMVLELSEKNPSQADAYKRLGWDALWAAIVAA